MSNKLARTDFIKGYVQPSLEENLPAIRITKALAKEVLKGDADSIEVRVTNDFAVSVLNAVESAYEQAIIKEQANIGFGGLGQLKVDVKGERSYRNPSDENAPAIVKPEHLAVKFGVSKGFKATLEATAIIK